MIASSFNYYDIVEALIDNGALVNLRSDDGFNALMKSVGANNIEIAKLLIEKGSDLNIKSEGGKTMLMIACENGNEELFNIFLENNLNINEKSNWGANMLIYASDGGNINIIKYLIGNGVDVNEKADYNGDTPLMWAILGKNPYEASKFLIENGALINVQNDSEVSPALLVVASDPKIVKLLKDNGCDLDTKFSSFATPLIYAINSARLEIVKALVENGCDINYCPNNGWQTPIFTAISAAQYEIAEYLLETKLVDLNKKIEYMNGREYNALEYAEYIGDENMIEIINKYYKK